ncbi:hypothetical protein BpHYR1_004077 [Brachionus plicatilis]|uniref:Uncharacterized protein n=1 Tax=Brachionus plicatilis TaxID=10195 RepID=A0A3M7PSZ2_BRAPC|nr:hypothetical protein BpHYR1_004077 [Brachionus plicatilis]
MNALKVMLKPKIKLNILINKIRENGLDIFYAFKSFNQKFCKFRKLVDQKNNISKFQNDTFSILSQNISTLNYDLH